jgi:hypothetical protein
MFPRLLDWTAAGASAMSSAGRDDVGTAGQSAGQSAGQAARLDSRARGDEGKGRGRRRRRRGLAAREEGGPGQRIRPPGGAQAALEVMMLPKEPEGPAATKAAQRLRRSAAAPAHVRPTRRLIR